MRTCVVIITGASSATPSLALQRLMCGPDEGRVVIARDAIIWLKTRHIAAAKIVNRIFCVP
ncbi:MAG: hypothetical protein CEE40_05835 [Chloroflexi bacterium B3_Chlor]|nr:MAG: hypothetical protein CEE40_05835 [Chloroflexi bacterium B3_Chlor]